MAGAERPTTSHGERDDSAGAEKEGEHAKQIPAQKLLDDTAGDRAQSSEFELVAGPAWRLLH
jgi:hypothetical protein